MAPVGEVKLVPVAVVPSSFEAKVVAARLGSEGIVCQLRGNVDGMYPLGNTTVLVPEAEVVAARELLAADALASKVDAGYRVPDELATPWDPDDADAWGPIGDGPPLRTWTQHPLWRIGAWVGLVALALAAARTLVNFMV